MKSLTERAKELAAVEEKELAAAEEESQKVEGEAIQREKAAANELLRNVNQYLEQKKISNVRASPRDTGVRLECGADHLEITATGQVGQSNTSSKPVILGWTPPAMQLRKTRCWMQLSISSAQSIRQSKGFRHDGPLGHAQAEIISPTGRLDGAATADAAES
jgi:hypothetical protein